MIQNKNAFVLLTVGLMFLTGILRADDSTPASTMSPASDSTTPTAAPKKLTIKEAMKAAGDLADAGKTEKAIAAYEAIGKLPSKKGESWRQNSEGLAYLEAATPEPEKAIPPLENAVAINADNYFARNNLGSAYEQTDQPKKAEDAYQKAIDTAKAAGASTDKGETNLKALQAKTGDVFEPAPAAGGSATSDASTSVTSGSAVPDNSTPGAGAVSSK